MSSQTTKPAGPAAPADSHLPRALLAHWSRILGLCLGQTGRAVDDMSQVLAEWAAEPELTPAARDLLARLNEGLQYQDRQRQMLELLQADLQAADRLPAGQATAFDMEAWLARFEAHCPIPELRRTQPGDGHGGAQDLELF
ncbi:hypothetical protein DIC66_07360 [Rhodoferax lacus]|uniref:Uncharacterized protein n=1 Tax=Rhodoferax lacus TaxID=2184758 RepID=A0A3E1RE74_9BURK|nr:hypothetical protein [Rhodoferax lacus]RFO97667.1 hypothetical protein DIC66_07360 [Rhodoferax lacus]